MAEQTDLDLDTPMVVPGGYVESPDHKPNPFYQSGTVETTDFGTTPSTQMREVSSVFAEAEANNLVIAARALDPNDPTPAELVVLPEASVIVNGSARTAEEAREEVFASIRAKQENPTVLGTSSAAASAALGTAPEDAEGQETDEDRQRAEFKEEAATAHEERLRAARDQETAAPVATTSSTPSAETPKAAPASSPTGTDPKSDTASPTAAARKPAAGTPKK